MSKYKSTTAFQDLLFNMLIGFVFLFIVALLLINPITKKSDAPKKAEYLITIEWADASYNDIDLWVRDPSGNIVSFINKGGGLLHLERDDLGQKNDTINGVTLLRNEETVTLRGIEPGEYEVMYHVYFMRSQAEDKTVRFRLTQINPYGIRLEGEKPYEAQGQAVSLFRFTLDEEGRVVDTSQRPSDFIPRRGYAAASDSGRL